MATKLKKSRGYERKWKNVAIIIIFICATAIFFCGIVTANISKHWSGAILEADSVYETDEFLNEIAHAVDEIIYTEGYAQDEDRINAGELVDRDELITGFKRYYGIIDGIITGNTEINDTFDGLIIEGTIPASLMDNLEEYQYLVENRLPLYRKMYIQNQLDDYRSSIRYIDSLTNLLYYVEDGDGEIVAGNSSRAQISALTHTITLSSGFANDNIGITGYLSNISLLENCDYRIYAGMKEVITPGDNFYSLLQEYDFAKANIPVLAAVFALGLVIIIAAVIYLISVTGQKEKNGAVYYMAVDRIYNEIHLLIALAAFGILINLCRNLLEWILYETNVFWIYISTMILGIAYLGGVALFVSYITSVARQIKGKRFMRNTWVASTIRSLSELFTGKTFRGWMIFVMLCYGLGNCVLMGACIIASFIGYRGIGLLMLLALMIYNIFCVILLIRALSSLKLIMISARETSKGNLQFKLNLDEISPSFLNFAEDISNIQEGLKNSVDEAVKGERMKTELITNVSHDLKTPLTSIITYVDLLKNAAPNRDKAREYIDILQDKSYRLKQLIEDLIEASKVSSGNITVNLTRVDCRQLTLQAIGEMEEKIEERGLDIKLNCDEVLYILADGRHMWRIFENLLTNAIKYAMPNSRVYVDIFRAEDRGVLVMKNISEAPIDFDETRLTDRFVRGDASRTTEGSGLGLSIAQSLAEAQDGTFGIKVDGDLFKAIISMPLWREEYVLEGSEENIQE